MPAVNKECICNHVTGTESSNHMKEEADHGDAWKWKDVVIRASETNWNTGCHCMVYATHWCYTCYYYL